MGKTIATAGLVLLAGAGDAFAGAPLALDAAMKLLARPGSWIEADGTFLPDGSFEAKEIEVRAPDDPDLEEPAIYGAVSKLDPAKSSMKVLGYAVTWDAKTTFKDENKKLIQSSKVQDGIGVKVQGTVQPNGTFLATKVKTQAVKNVAGKAKVKEKIFGPVTIVDPRRGSMRVMNTNINLRADATFVEYVAAPAPTP